MGCHMNKAQQRLKLSNQESFMLENQLETEYSQQCYRGRGNSKYFEQQIDIKIGDIKYQLLLTQIDGQNQDQFQSFFCVQCDLGVFQTLPLQYNHPYDSNLYALLLKQQLLILTVLKSKEKIISIKSYEKHQVGNLVLNLYQDTLFIRCLKLKKLVLKIKVGNTLQLRFDKEKSFLIDIIRDGVYDAQKIQFILINIQNRLKFISQTLIIYILGIFEIKNTNDLLLEIKDQGLVLYNLDFESMNIVRTKLIYVFKEMHVKILDDNNLLHIFSKDFYLKLDRDYNIIKQYRLDFLHLANTYINWVGIINGPAEQPDHYTFYRKGYNFLFNENNSKNQIDYDYINKQQMYYLTEFNNYQKEYIHLGPIQHIISSNQRYLTYNIQQNLIFYKIQEDKEYQIYHNKNINFINFSKDSNNLYVVLEDRVNCYKVNQSLKLQHKFYFQINHLSSNQKGFFITINDKGQARTISKQFHKQIFKLNTIKTKYISFEYQTKHNNILVSSDSEISLFCLIKRKLIWNLQIKNRQTKIIQNTDYFFILTEEERVELWSVESNNVQFCRDIMSNIQALQIGYSNKQCLRNREYIFILDQNFNFIEQIYLQQEYIEYLFIDNYSQIIQENYFLRVSVNINYYGSQQQKILISIDKREQAIV